LIPIKHELDFKVVMAAEASGSQQPGNEQGASMKSTHLLLTLLVATAAGGAAGTARAADAAAGQAVFRSQCSICHSVQPGRNMIGPSLAGIVGRKAGQQPDFHYSAANKGSGITWDAATLDRYLTSPQAVVPHTIMTYGGLKDATKRANLIAYLATVH
jgi:cytochrome c2